MAKRNFEGLTKAEVSARLMMCPTETTFEHNHRFGDPNIPEAFHTPEEIDEHAERHLRETWDSLPDHVPTKEEFAKRFED